MRNSVTIHMGAGDFQAVVKADNKLTVFDMNKLGKHGEDTFRKELVFAWREAANPSSSTQVEPSSNKRRRMTKRRNGQSKL